MRVVTCFRPWAICARLLAVGTLHVTILVSVWRRRKQRSWSRERFEEPTVLIMMLCGCVARMLMIVSSRAGLEGSTVGIMTDTSRGVYRGFMGRGIGFESV